MRRTWVTAGWLSMALLIAAGCKTSEPNLKPPPHPEEYNVPPEDDARFSKPVEYPRSELNKDILKKNQGLGGANVPGGPSPSRFGAGPGMRPY